VLANIKAVEALIGRPVTDREYITIARQVGAIHKGRQ
jgi:hypothetical protein